MTNDIAINVSTYLPYHNIYWYAEYSPRCIIEHTRKIGREGRVINISGRKKTHTVIFLLTGEAIMTSLSLDLLTKKIESAKTRPAVPDIRLTTTSYIPYHHILWYSDCKSFAVKERIRALQETGDVLDLTGRKKRLSVVFLVTGRAILLNISAKTLAKRIEEAKHIAEG